MGGSGSNELLMQINNEGRFVSGLISDTLTPFKTYYESINANKLNNSYSLT